MTERLIYNYQPLYTSPDYDFVQIYLFDESDLGQKVDVTNLRTA
jgi:hypothetical protein